MLRMLYKIFIIILPLWTAITTTSCKKPSFNFDFKIKNDKATVSEVKEEKVGPELTKLTGDVVTKSKHKLPNENDVISGFKVLGIYDYDNRNAKVVTFSHEKTKAKVVLVSNDDVDRAFNIGFATYPKDNKGIPHVFEHATLTGSKNYDSVNVFYEVKNKTYNTYMNAHTYNQATMYTASSLSDEQLFSMYKVYLDGVFRPNLLTDDKLLNMQGYRYVLNDKNDDLEVSGIVYSEMLGNENIPEKNYSQNAKRTIYENSFLNYNSGGEPDSIVTITPDELKEFHDKYYIPSNMVLVLYGDINYEKYLEYMDKEYIGEMDYKEVEEPDKGVNLESKFVEKTFDLPVASGSNTDKTTNIQYIVKTNGITPYETAFLDIIISALVNEDGVIKKRLLKEIPQATVKVVDETLNYYPYFSIMFSNVDESDKEKIKEIVSDAFADLKENGIDKKVFDEIIDNREMAYENEKDSYGFIDKSVELMYFALRKDRNVLSYFEYEKGRKDIEYMAESDIVKKLIDKYLCDTDNKALCITKAKPGLLEEKANRRKENLREIKNKLNDGDINYLINFNKEYDNWVKENEKKSIIDKVRVASISSLSTNTTRTYVYEENYGGIRFLESDIDDMKYNHTELLFDASGVEFNDLHKLKLLANLLIDIPSENYKENKLKAEFDLYANSFGTYIEVVHNKTSGYRPYLSFYAISLDKHLDKIFELFDETLYRTDFTDIKRIRECIEEYYNTKKRQIKSDVPSIGKRIADSKIRNDYNYDIYINDIEYVKFLNDLLTKDDDELREVVDDMQRIYKEVVNKRGLTCKLIGNLTTIKNSREKIIDLSSKMINKNIKSVDYSELLPNFNSNVVIETDSSNNYNFMSINFKDTNFSFDGKLKTLLTVIDDKVMYPEFRAKRSCYGAGAIASNDGLHIYTYKDPNIKETFDVYKKIPEIIDKISLTEKDLFDYKLNAYAELSYPLTKYEAADTGINETLGKWDERRPKRYERYLNEIKSMTLKDFDDYKKIFKELVEKGSKTTAGSIASIEKDKKEFDIVITDYIK